MNDMLPELGSRFEILEALERAGMTDYEEYPELHMAWKVAKETHDFCLLEELLNQDPWILFEAQKRNREFPFFQPKREELEEIQGEFNLGFLIGTSAPVGLNTIDFTRGLFVCGETGSGKTYPILRICDEILSIQKTTDGSYTDEDENA